MIRLGSHPLARGVLALAFCLLLAAPESAQAQRPGRRGAGPKTRQTVQPRASENDAGEQPGLTKGRIVKFVPAKDESEEDAIGTLKVKPLAKGSKQLTLLVRRSDILKVSVGNHNFSIDELADILAEGLFVSADWGFKEEASPGAESDKENKKPKKPSVKELRSLTFDTLPVEGKIEEIGGEEVVLKIRPKGEQLWPDIEAARANKTKPANAKEQKPAKAPPKKMKLRILDDATKFADAANQALTLADFEVDQQVEATIVYGKKAAYLVELRSLTAEERPEGEEGKGPEVGPKRPGEDGPRPKGPRTRHGGRGGA